LKLFSSKPTTNPQRPTSHSTPIASATTMLLDDDILSSKSDSPPPLPEHEQDILLVDYHNKFEYLQVERYLSDEIGCPIKLLTSKEIFSENKDKQRYFCIYIIFD